MRDLKEIVESIWSALKFIDITSSLNLHTSINKYPMVSEDLKLSLIFFSHSNFKLMAISVVAAQKENDF